MAQHYTDPKRAADTWSLPDLEVFYRTKRENRADGWIDDDGDPLPAGWYYWACLPGCLPDSDPSGPYASEAEALAEAREYAGIYDDDDDAGEHVCRFGAFEESRFAGTVHRKCLTPGCKNVCLDGDDDAD